MIIAVDIDNTVLKCNSLIYKVMNNIPSLGVSKKALSYEVVKKKDKIEQNLISKMISKIFRICKSKYYTEIENSVSVLNNLYDKGCKIILLSSRPNYSFLTKALKEWCELNNLKYSAMVLACNKKSEFCLKFHIDYLIDNSSNIYNSVVEKGCKTILFAKPRKFCLKKDLEMASSDKKVCFSWDEIAEAIK